MEMTELGKTGIKVSRICIGAWQAAGWATSDDERFIKVVRHAMDKGLNFIDTAEGYGNGHSEEVVAKALEGHRDEMIVATKFGPWNAKGERLEAALENSLKRLQTDHIDLYQYHWPSPEIPLEETISELEKYREQGKIRAIGVSNWMGPEWEEFGDAGRIDSLQPCHSLLWRTVERKVLPLCIENNVAVIPYSPLCQGALAGRFRKMEDIPEKDPRHSNKVWTKEKLPGVLKVVDKLEEIGRKYDKTIAQTAIRWLLDQPGITAPIVGASRPAQVDDNVGALDWNLDDADWRELSELSLPLSDDLTYKDSMWGWHSKYPKKEQ